jgi:hypothetical protein
MDFYKYYESKLNNKDTIKNEDNENSLEKPNNNK